MKPPLPPTKPLRGLRQPGLYARKSTTKKADTSYSQSEPHPPLYAVHIEYVADSDEAAAQEPSACDDPEFSRLEAPAIEQGKVVAAADANAEQETAKLIPTLAEIRDHLSIRGCDHQRGQSNVGPKRGNYFEGFLARTGIERCSRTITRRIDEFSASNGEKQPDDPMQEAPKSAKKSTKKPDEGDVVEPVSQSDRDEQAPIEATLSVAAPINKFDHHPDTAAADTPQARVDDNNDSSKVNMDDEWAYESEKLSSVSNIKPACHCALGDYLISTCAKTFKAALKGLSADAEIYTLRMIFERILKFVFGPSLGDGKFIFISEYEKADPLELRKEQF